MVSKRICKLDKWCFLKVSRLLFVC